MRTPPIASTIMAATRELHLEDGVAVADPAPYVAPSDARRVADDRILLVEGPKFVLERWPGGTRTITLPDGMTGWFVPCGGRRRGRRRRVQGRRMPD